MKAYSDMLTHTSTEDAPWYVIPADNKWFMRYAVGEIICDRINDLKLHYPVLTETAKQELEAAKRILAPQNTEAEKPKTSPRTPKAAKIKTIKDKQAAKSDRKTRKQ